MSTYARGFTRPMTAAENALVMRNIRFIESRVNAWVRRAPQRWVPIREDLRQEAVLAAMRAAQGFDPERGYAYITYAVRNIDQAIRTYALRRESAVTTPYDAPEGGRRGWAPMAKMADAEVLEDHAADNDDYRRVEARRTVERALADVRKEMAEPDWQGNVRNSKSVDAYVETVVASLSVEERARKLGLTRQRVLQLYQKSAPFFESWAARVAQEAA